MNSGHPEGASFSLGRSPTTTALPMQETEVAWRERSRAVRAIRLLRTRRPRTFRDKVRYKMLRDHRPLLVTFADKAAVRTHVAAAVGEHYLPVS